MFLSGRTVDRVDPLHQSVPGSMRKHGRTGVRYGMLSSSMQVDMDGRNRWATFISFLKERGMRGEPRPEVQRTLCTEVTERQKGGVVWYSRWR